MYINIVTVTSGWILSKIAERTASYYQHDDIEFSVTHAPHPKADVNYYVCIQNCYFGYKTKCDIGYFCHVHQDNMAWLHNIYKAQKFYQLDGIISMNKRQTDNMLKVGYPPSKLTTIVPGETKDMFPLKKIVIGIVSRGGQPDYGPKFMEQFLSTYDCTNFKFRFLGRDWDNVYSIVNNKNIEAEFLTDADYSIYPEFYRNIDYLLVQGIATAGPMAMQEALSTGVPVIGADVGFVNYEFKPDYTFPPGNVEQLSAILDNIQAPRLARRAQVEHMTWKQYAEDVMSFIKKIKAEKGS